MTRRHYLSLVAGIGFIPALLAARSPGAHHVRRDRPVALPQVTYGVLVTPHLASGVNWGPNTTSHTAAFRIKNTGTAHDSYTYKCLTTGNVTCVSPITGGANLYPGDTAAVTVTYSVGGPGSGTLKLAVQGTTVADTGLYNVDIGKPIPTLTGMPYDNQDLSRCAAGCFQYGYAQSTVPYFSMGAARGITLVYRQDRNITQPFIAVDVQQPSTTTSTWPVKYWLQATINGAQVTFANGEQTLKFVAQTAVRPERLAGQLNRVTNRTTRVDSLKITVTAEFAGGVTTQTVIPTQIAIVEEKDSPIGQGWTLGGIQRAYQQADGKMLVTDGNGSAAYFTYFGGGAPESPDASTMNQEFSGTTLIGYTRRYGDSTTVWFDLTGKMTKVTDAFSNTTNIGYDASGRVDSVIDPMGRAIVLSYDANGLHTITDPGGRVTTVTVDASRRLTAIQDPDGKSTTFGYDTNTRLTSVTDRRGKVTTVYPGVSGLIDSVAAPAVPIYGGGTLRPTTRFHGWQLDGVPYTLTSTTPLNPPWTSDVRGRVTEPGGAATSFTVDRWGQPVTLANAAGDTTKFTYDGSGRLIKQVLPYYGQAAADSLARDSWGLPIYQRVAAGPAVNLHRAPYGQIDSIWTDADSVPIQRPYIGAGGRVDSVAIARVVRQRIWYDNRGRVDSVLNALGQFIVRYHYDAVTGNVDTVTAPGGLKTAYGYDTFGRPTTVRAPGRALQATYYNVLNRPDSSVTSDGTRALVVKYGYDEVFVRSVTDGKGQTDSLFYNDVGWLTQEKDAAGSSTLYAYSLDGDLRQKTNRRGQAITYTYDVLHRITQKFGVNTDSVTWAYSAPAQRTITATSPVSTETSYFNVRGQPDSVKTAMAGQTYWRRYRYRRTGQLVSDTITGGGLTWQPRTYSYDTATAVLKSIALGGRVTSLRADANFAVRARTLPGGEVDTVSLGNLGVPLDRKTTNAPYAGTTDRLLSLDAGYRIQQQFKNVTPAAGRFFTYDSLGQLTSAADKHWTTALPGNCLSMVFGYNCQAAGSGWTTDNSVTYSYDLAGNRTSQSGTYGPANRITGFNGCTYGTDADGNVTSRTCSTLPTANATFTWSAEGQLTSVTQVYSNYTNYLHYDAAGYLVRRDSATVPTGYYLWDMGNPLATLDGSGTHKGNELSYYPGLDRLHAAISENHDTIPYYAHLDGAGSVIGVTDASKSLGSSFAYDDWGVTNFTGGTDSANVGGDVESRWKGAVTQWMAGADLYYMRNRWYEPRTGRFLSEDPIGLAGGLNQYTYAGNDPINGADPTGLISSGIRSSCRYGYNTTDANGNDLTGYLYYEGFFQLPILLGCGGPKELWGNPWWEHTAGGGGHTPRPPEPASPPKATCSVSNLSFSVPAALVDLPTVSVGVAADIVQPLVDGLTFGLGFYVGGQGAGLYGKVGIQRGIDFSYGFEGGITDRLGGNGTEAQVGLGPLSVSAGSGHSAGLGIGWGLPITVRAGRTETTLVPVIQCSR